MLKKLLIANRGEIVIRIAKTCRRLGIPVATVHSTADRNALHVRTVGESIELGPAPSTQSYLNIAAVVRAARAVGADAVHPGIGFLSESPELAEAVEAAGLIFVGPGPDLLRRFGDKWAAKREARQARVPVIEGSEGSSTDAAEIERLIHEKMQLPVMLKATAGGGGRGVRVVREAADLSGAIQSAMREAASSFGRPDLIVEEFIDAARHVEVQVAGDGNGNAIHLFERECSLQRRFQKVIEEAPASHLAPDLRERILGDAVRLARSVRYKGLGTVEFLVTGDRHLFLECNPRLQVEHTVTEEITGIDLVELQLRIAADGALPLAQSDIHVSGHSVQLRVYAEDAAKGFLPSTGTLTDLRFPEHARVETGVDKGSEITPHYDALIAKIIVRDDDRAGALSLSRAALEETNIAGVETNLAFLASLLDDPVVIAGDADNRFIDREIATLGRTVPPTDEHFAIAAAMLWQHERPAPSLGLWSGANGMTGWRYASGKRANAATPALSLSDKDGRSQPVSFLALPGAGRSIDVAVGEAHFVIETRGIGDSRCLVLIGDTSSVVSFAREADAIGIRGPFGSHRFGIAPYLSADTAAAASEGQVAAPMMGAILKVNVIVGQKVAKADVLVIEESMKMEMALYAPSDATVTAVCCKPGDIVERNQILIELEPIEGASDE